MFLFHWLTLLSIYVWYVKKIQIDSFKFFMSCLISLWNVVTRLSRLTECCNVYCIYAFIHYSHFCCHCTGWKILVGTDHFSSLEHQDDKIFFFLRRCSNQANFCGFILFTLLLWVCISYLFYVNLRKRSCYSTLFPLIHINTLDFSLKPNVVYWLCFYFLLMFCYLKKKKNKCSILINIGIFTGWAYVHWLSNWRFLHYVYDGGGDDDHAIKYSNLWNLQGL